MSELAGRGFEQTVSEYTESLAALQRNYRLPREWFAQPDHLAVKCFNAKHFDETVQSWLSGAREASYVKLDGRRLASINLGESLAFGGMFGSVEWLEVMEPRPEKAGLDTVGIDHAEFVFPDFTSAAAVLAGKNIPYEPQSNPNHRWLNIPINHRGQELKLNNRPLANIVMDGLESGEATML